jgi:hypothetical protein
MELFSNTLKKKAMSFSMEVFIGMGLGALLYYTER